MLSYAASRHDIHWTFHIVFRAGRMVQQVAGFCNWIQNYVTEIVLVVCCEQWPSIDVSFIDLRDYGLDSQCVAVWGLSHPAVFHIPS
jgi:hypothetical protein